MPKTIRLKFYYVCSQARWSRGHTLYAWRHVIGILVLVMFCKVIRWACPLSHYGTKYLRQTVGALVVPCSSTASLRIWTSRYFVSRNDVVKIIYSANVRKGLLIVLSLINVNILSVNYLFQSNDMCKDFYKI